MKNSGCDWKGGWYEDGGPFHVKSGEAGCLSGCDGSGCTPEETWFTLCGVGPFGIDGGYMGDVAGEDLELS